MSVNISGLHFEVANFIGLVSLNCTAEKKLAIFAFLCCIKFEVKSSFLVMISSLTDVLLCKIWAIKMPLWSFLFSSSYNLIAVNIERYVCLNSRSYFPQNKGMYNSNRRNTRNELKLPTFKPIG